MYGSHEKNTKINANTLILQYYVMREAFFDKIGRSLEARSKIEALYMTVSVFVLVKCFRYAHRYYGD